MEVVLKDIREQNITDIVCLGDIVGYGPNPVECLDQIRRVCKTVILGNHDQATLFDPDAFNPVALAAIYWTRDQLESVGPQKARDQRWEFLGNLPRKQDEGEFLFVHGSPRDPTNEYVFPENIVDFDKMSMLYKRFDKYCFQGHTHMPGVFLDSGKFVRPETNDFVFQLGAEKAMINVGSVGQPRDGDPRSCYVILDTDAKTIQYRRLKYPIEITRQKIYDIEDLDNSLGDRLVPGR